MNVIKAGISLLDITYVRYGLTGHHFIRVIMVFNNHEMDFVYESSDSSEFIHVVKKWVILLSSSKLTNHDCDVK